MEYIQGLDGQLTVFMHSLGIGFFFAVIYDVMCAVRFLLPGGRRVMLFTDILYAVICAFCSFCFMLVINEGRAMMYTVAAQLIGWTAHRTSVGAVARCVGEYAVYILRKFFRRIYTFVSRPFIFLKSKISSELSIAAEKRKTKFEKNEKNPNLLLKKWQGMLYTLNRSIYLRERRTNFKGKRKNVGKKAQTSKKT